ncbi:MAG: hypothetical protein AAGJ10_19565 [Bacteroidota bacterium]
MPRPRISGEALVSSFIKFGIGFIGTAATLVLLPRAFRITFRLVFWNTLRKVLLTSAIGFASGQAAKYAARLLQGKR